MRVYDEAGYVIKHTTTLASSNPAGPIDDAAHVSHIENKQRRIAMRFLTAGLVLFCTSSLTVGNDRGQSGIRLNAGALAYAKKVIHRGHVLANGQGAWREHRPSGTEENEFIRLHGFDEYAKWHLGIDDRYAENTKGRYKFAYGDFQNVHRCALLAVKSRGAEYKHHDIEDAAVQLMEMISSKKERTAAPLTDHN
jgi:hypothetical protein